MVSPYTSSPEAIELARMVSENAADLENAVADAVGYVLHQAGENKKDLAKATAAGKRFAGKLVKDNAAELESAVGPIVGQVVADVTENQITLDLAQRSALLGGFSDGVTTSTRPAYVLHGADRPLELAQGLDGPRGDSLRSTGPAESERDDAQDERGNGGYRPDSLGKPGSLTAGVEFPASMCQAPGGYDSPADCSKACRLYYICTILRNPDVPSVFGAAWPCTVTQVGQGLWKSECFDVPYAIVKQYYPQEEPYWQMAWRCDPASVCQTTEEPPTPPDFPPTDNGGDDQTNSDDTTTDGTCPQQVVTRSAPPPGLAGFAQPSNTVSFTCRKDPGQLPACNVSQLPSGDFYVQCLDTSALSLAELWKFAECGPNYPCKPKPDDGGDGDKPKPPTKPDGPVGDGDDGAGRCCPQVTCPAPVIKMPAIPPCPAPVINITNEIKLPTTGPTDTTPQEPIKPCKFEIDNDTAGVFWFDECYRELRERATAYLGVPKFAGPAPLWQLVGDRYMGTQTSPYP